MKRTAADSAPGLRNTRSRIRTAVRQAPAVAGLMLALHAAAQVPVRPDVVVDQTTQGPLLTVVARGKPGITPEELSQALDTHLATACPQPQASEPRLAGEYRYLDTAADEAAPKGTMFFPVRQFMTVKRAPSLLQRLQCPAMAPPASAPAAPLRLAILSPLSDTLRFADLRPAGTTRLLELPWRGPTLHDLLAQALREAFAARGQPVDVVLADQPHDLRVFVRPARVPGEALAGPVLATKIGAFGISKVSVAYSSIEVSLYRTRPLALLATAHVQTFQGLPLLYEDWDREMAGGPAAALQDRSSALMQTMLADNVQAAVLTVSPQLMQRLPAP